MIHKPYRLIPYLLSIVFIVQCNYSNTVEQISNSEQIATGQPIARVLFPGIERTIYPKAEKQEANLLDFRYEDYKFVEKHTGIPGNNIGSVYAISKHEIIVASYNKIGILKDGLWQSQHHYNTGIPNDAIKIVQKNKDGNLLIGFAKAGFVIYSEDGIRKYDKESLGLAGYEIHDFHQSDDGLIHLSSARDYCQIKNGESENLTTEQSDPSINKQFPFAPRKYSVGPDKHLYGSHYNQLLRYSESTWKLYPLPEPPAKPQHYGVVANEHFIYALGNKSDEIYVLDSDQWNKLTLAPEATHSKVLNIHAINKDEFYVIFNHGINHFKKGQLTKITLSQIGLGNNCVLTTSSLAPDGTLAIGGNHGIAVLNDGNWIIHNAEKSLVHSTQFFGAVTDKNGNVFLSHDKGITKLNNGNSSFVLAKSDLGNTQNITISEAGKIYFSTYDSIYDFSDETPKAISTADIFAMCMDVQGENLTFGTGNEIGIYNGNEIKMITDSLIKSTVNSVCYAEDGTLYIGTSSTGGKLIEYKSGSFKAIDDLFSRDINNRIADIHSRGKVVAAASNYGWLRKRKGKWENMPKHLPEENEPANGVQAILIAQSNKIYLAGRYGKLYIYHPNGNYQTVDLNKFLKLDTIDKINGIIQDDKGDIYILTVNGLLIYYGD